MATIATQNNCNNIYFPVMMTSATVVALPWSLTQIHHCINNSTNITITTTLPVTIILLDLVWFAVFGGIALFQPCHFCYKMAALWKGGDVSIWHSDSSCPEAHKHTQQSTQELAEEEGGRDTIVRKHNQIFWIKQKIMRSTRWATSVVFWLQYWQTSKSQMQVLSIKWN